MLKVFKIILGLILGIWLFHPEISLAASEQIISLDSQTVAHQDGSFNVTENIIYDFGSAEKHGIYRDIPLVSKVGELYRKNDITFTQILRDDLNETHTLSVTGDKVSIKIGDPNKTITGSHTYTISYLVKNGIGSNFEDHDEIYWNVTGNSWQVPILSASAKIATDFPTQINEAACYTGPQDSRNQDCRYDIKNPTVTFETSSSLEPYQGLTIVASFPVNTFPKSILSRNLPSDYLKNEKEFFLIVLFAIPIILNLVLAPILLVWYFKRKAKKHFGPVSVNFDFPEDEKGNRITPAEAGTIDDSDLDKNDIVATIFDFAIRKYVKIEQVKNKKVLGIFSGGNDFKVIKLKDGGDLNTFEQTLFNRLFQNGDEINISSLKSNFYETFNKLGEEIFNLLVKRGFYSKNPDVQRGLLLAGAIISAVTLNLILMCVLIFFYKKLIGRTAKGDLMDWKIDGLKLFLKNMSREYKWQAENLYTVEKYIPYAMALGYINEFMEQLKIIYPDYKPNWYSGYAPFYLTSSIMFSSMQSNFTTSAPHSASGLSSGGYSGGGGGGGGGGSW
ncbi:MAG: DUF2207 domain-containing protein [Candidatus Daviesbacteria bacterium]